MTGKQILESALGDQAAQRTFIEGARRAISTAFPAIQPSASTLRADVLLERTEGDSIIALVELRFVCTITASGILIPRLVPPPLGRT